MHNPVLAFVLLIVDSTLIVWVWQSMFDGWDDFFNAVGYWIKPDWISLIQGDYVEDWWQSTKLGGALGLTILLAAAPIYVAFG